MNKNKPFTILSLEGGGMDGMIYCFLLAELEKVSGRKCCEIFSLITGTSIGSIVGALLSIGVPAKDCVQFFMDNGPIIFEKKWYKLGLFSPKYPAGAIEGVLKGKFGFKTLKDCKTKLLVPAFNLTTEDPEFFKSYGDNTDMPLWAVCRASSSAQVYFRAFEYKDNIYWDGGNFSNSPEADALADAIKLGNKIKDIKILSLGCGDYPTTDDPNKYKNCGAIRNLIKTFAVLFSTGSEDCDYKCKTILGDNFLVISPKEKQRVGLDTASPADLQKRHEMGTQWVKDHFWQIEEFLNLK